jgi:hypothetical protein
VSEMIMGENYERNITLIRSDISRFSRGTDALRRRQEDILAGNETLPS